MQYLYIATVFAGALVCLLASLLLFVRRKTGERSRVILAVIVFFSVYNYITRFIALCQGDVPEFVVSAKMLLQANFMVIAYIVYPIEVILPGWLNFRRIVKLYAPWLFLLCIYLISLWTGVQYTPYRSLLEMFAHADRFEVWFRLVLSLLIFSPGLVVFFIHRTRHFRNSDHVWMRKYLLTFSVNVFAYILVLMFNHPILHVLYYYVSVGCSLFIVYMELFDRLIGKPIATTTIGEKNTQQEKIATGAADVSLPFEKYAIEQKNAVLVNRLETYMKENSAWRDPDLSLNTLASELFTNRTTLAQAMRENGYENYTHYINRLRIDDFVQQIESEQSENFQEAFFAAGFRSRGTALRNFRQFAGMTPSEYFQKKDTGIEKNTAGGILT
ncbi:MAG TPA: AraC family transcriptional regulator [Petrimonas sp.]|uniref:AraC family transcriptional regulator n=1 Tax=Petrimonas sp. TaxID=2023866 RepID=UPI001778556C|nr:AraC family transcriptional regulator [Petrimonas sp.]